MLQGSGAEGLQIAGDGMLLSSPEGRGRLGAGVLAADEAGSVLMECAGLARKSTHNGGMPQGTVCETAADNLTLRREYAAYLRVEKGSRPATIEAYGRDLEQLAEHLERRRSGVLAGTREEDLRAFLGELRSNGVESRAIARKLSALRGFFRWLLLDKRMMHDPTANLESPATWKVLPKSLAEVEVGALLERSGDAARAGDTGPGTLRDHAILELLYAGGLRVSEICALRVEDLKLDAGRAQVRGKGDKDRVVPLGRAACEALEVWLARGRPELQRKAAGRVVGIERRLFLGTKGRPVSRQWVWAMVRRSAAEVGVTASPHMLRHSCATHMVEHGADLRTVQTLLGHADIATTQVYTHTALGRLKAVHRAHHPRSRRRGLDGGSAEALRVQE